MTRLGRIALIDAMQFFPKAQTLVFQHLHKAVEVPIIIYHAVAYAPLALLFGGLALVFLDDHLPLGKIANDYSPFSQCASDEVRGFMQTVLLFTTFLFSNPLVDLGEVKVPTRFLLALVPLGANLVELLVVVAIAFE